MEQKKYWVQSFQGTVAIACGSLLYIKLFECLLFYAYPYIGNSYLYVELWGVVVLLVALLRVYFFPTKGRKSVNAKREFPILLLLIAVFAGITIAEAIYISHFPDNWYTFWIELRAELTLS